MHVFARLAEYNIGGTAGTFAGSHKNDSSGYYKQGKAEDACPPGYRLPSKDEFNLFIPDLENKISFTNKVAYRIIGDGIDCTAYRYELVGNFEEGAVDSQLKITGRYLGDNYPRDNREYDFRRIVVGRS